MTPLYVHVVQLRYIQMAAQSDYPKEEPRYGAGAATCTSDHEEQQNNETKVNMTRNSQPPNFGK